MDTCVNEQIVHCYHNIGDLSLGVLLILLSVAGIPANFLSCAHFVRFNPKNNNHKYFSLLYASITGVDFIICFGSFPVIQALITDRYNTGLLFGQDLFCSSWYIIWIVLQQEVIFLVAMLSFSRLCLLKNKLTRLPIRAACLLPALYGLFVLVVLGILPIVTRYSPITYQSELGLCWLSSEDDDEAIEHNHETFTSSPMFTSSPIFTTAAPGNYTGFSNTTDAFHANRPLYKKYFERMLTKSIVEAVIFGLPVIPIFASLASSLYLLEKVRRTNTSSISSKPENEASKTVVIVTLVYLLFNFPSLIKSGYLCYLYWTGLCLLQDSSTTGFIFSEYVIAQYTPFGKYGWHYFFLLGYGVLPIFKSAVSPLVYFWRVKSIRNTVTYFQSKAKKKARTVHRRVTQYALPTYRRMTQHQMRVPVRVPTLDNPTQIPYKPDQTQHKPK